MAASCRFLSLPVEIRQHLSLPHGTHALIHDGKVSFSACITSYYDDENFIGDERRSDDPSLSEDEAETLYSSRLQSTWGPHWECEERFYDKCSNQESITTRIEFLEVSRQTRVVALPDKFGD